MPDSFTAFPPQNRQANTVYNSGAYSVSPDSPDMMVRLYLTALDIVNEPDTTVIHWVIERNPGTGWVPMISVSFRGLNGITPPKTPATIATNINNVLGQDVRASVWFESAGDANKRWGVSGELY